MTAPVKRTTEQTRSMAYIALFAVFMGVCAWLCVPATVPFTMQTFALFLALGVLGGRRGTAAVVVYLLMGLVGMPVFSHFTGGPGVLFQAAGGYLPGFLCAALVMWGMQALLGQTCRALGLSMLAGLLVCYAVATVWFMVIYTRTTQAISLGTALLWCVVPYILPDLAKLALALLLTKRLSRLVR